MAKRLVRLTPNKSFLLLNCFSLIFHHSHGSAGTETSREAIRTGLQLAHFLLDAWDLLWALSPSDCRLSQALLINSHRLPAGQALPLSEMKPGFREER